MLSQITQKILSQIPENLKLNTNDILILNKNKDYIVGLKEEIATRFYDILYAEEVTRSIFHEGERPIREKSLQMWVEKTFHSDYDLKYWEWQTFVGILHIKRNVKNNMMVAMIGAVTEILIEKSMLSLDKNDAVELLKAWMKLSSIVTSLIVEGYRLFYLKAIENVTGLSESLLDNTVKVEIDNLIAQNSKFRM